MKQKNNLFLKQIAETIVQNTTAINGVGLFNGKAGIALFLYKYSRYFDDKIIRAVADQLVDEICEEMSSIPNMGFSNGLAGIGWCFCYLLRESFLDESTDESLFDVDEIILKKQSPHSIIHEYGSDIFGAGIYCLARLYTPVSNQGTNYQLLKTQNIIYLIDECENMLCTHLIVNTKVPIIKPQALISIVYFLLEAYALNLNVKKVKNILGKVLPYFESSLRFYSDNEERSFLKNIVEKVSILDDVNIKYDYEIFTKKNLSDSTQLNLAIPDIMYDVCKTAIYDLIYDRPSIKNSDASRNAIVYKTLNASSLRETALYRPNNYNLGINGGLAGVGLAFLSSMGNN